MAEQKIFTETERKHIIQGLGMLLVSTRRAENQMRLSNRDAVAEAIKIEVFSISDTLKKAERLL